jgi:hypothetical protein
MLTRVALTDGHQRMACCKAPELPLGLQLLPAAQHQLRDWSCCCCCLLASKLHRLLMEMLFLLLTKCLQQLLLLLLLLWAV